MLQIQWAYKKPLKNEKSGGAPKYLNKVNMPSMLSYDIPIPNTTKTKVQSTKWS